ncbi:MAG: cytochrome P460 family protein [Gammaproteobacteria bacterium]|nr:cytochrome P460 family protein [Gammaproteobacteria bacterium]
MKIVTVVIALSCCAVSIADDSFTSTYESLVDDAGNITMPKTFQSDWTFLGTWSIAKEDVETSAAASGHGAAALHNVYTQPGIVEAFRNTGTFPDGAVLIKELLDTETAQMTTGKVSRGNKIEGWFVMVKDTEGRFLDNKLWGDGWGWFLFDASNNLTTKDYKAECLGCHIPAKQNDWIYTEGYPILQKP